MILIVWDNGGKSFDRYTVRVGNDYFGMSHNLGSPQGFIQYVGSWPEIDESCLGKEIKQRDYKRLPEKLRSALMEV